MFANRAHLLHLVESVGVGGRDSWVGALPKFLYCL